MTKNTSEEYKKGIREKFEIEKNGVHADVFLNPSRAKLRNLCFELFKDNSNPDDSKVFESFFKYKFSVDCRKKLKEETDKFRPIENFLKGETEPADFETVNMAAILVDFQPRPFLKFSKKENTDTTTDIIEKNPTATFVKTTNKHTKDLPYTDFPQKLTITTDKKRNNKKITILLLVFATVLGLGFSVKQIFFPKKQCMEWQKDHYVVVDCTTETQGFVRIPFDESLTDFRRIWPCDTTTFFKDGKPILWYCKSGDEIELYNKPGFDPVYEKPLKAITPYMMKTYFAAKKQD
ncbi:hypothetical protein [Flavobacterium suncheonense]|uniref:hypothetical protein n=1 Tax=Flavobacterium suncheonense TaxID=350894 RepID=UPI0004008447|nr:hypothetical protein [Flavobacterium suncheonense]